MNGACRFHPAPVSEIIPDAPTVGRRELRQGDPISSEILLPTKSPKSIPSVIGNRPTWLPSSYDRDVPATGFIASFGTASLAPTTLLAFHWDKQKRVAISRNKFLDSCRDFYTFAHHRQPWRMKFSQCLAGFQFHHTLGAKSYE